ncbi:MAG: PASTA domain-containing protein [Clostridia bacterium]|nr:PASTA domain-containing protein [Clostridia bacterium]
MKKSDLSVTKSTTKRRSITVFSAFLLFAAFLLFNVFRLDVLMYDHYKESAFEQITTSSVLKAERGVIYDSSMNPLATTETSWRIFASPKAIRQKSSSDGVDYKTLLSGRLGEILNTDPNTLYTKLSSNVLDVTLKNSATRDEYESTLALVDELDADDLIFTEAQSSRSYPEGSLAAHVLGFVGSDNQGLYGLEYSYNDILKGTDGYYVYAKDAGGNPMPGEYISYEPATDGCSIVTTIDGYIQEQLEARLGEIVTTHGVQNRATGIVMDTETGAILAMATSSPFDPNTPFLLDDISQEKLAASGLAEGSEEYKAYKNELLQIMWSNKAVSEIYEPGSTFKIITVAAALDSGVASTTDHFDCPGYKMVGGWRIKCHKRTGHGSGFSLAYGLQMSCNPTMMTVAERIGAERFYEYVKAFGYFEDTGIDLPSEGNTVFHKPDAIGTTELATASFGQRFKVSIIGHLTAIAAVANGGNLVEPYLVQRVIDSEGNIVSEHETTVKRRVISEEVASTLATILEEGVSGDGGAKNAYVNGYLVAAKTGTSEKFDILDENGNSYLRISSTVAFAPSGEHGIAVIIVADEPTGAVKYGSVVAAPYVSLLLEDILPYLDYKSSAEPTEQAVKSYVGMNINSAKRELEEMKIKYEVIGDGGVVVAQAPAMGVTIETSTSTVYLYTKKRDDTVTVPSVVGKSLAEANRILVDAGLNVRIRGVKDPGAESILTVSLQSLTPGASVSRGTVIEIMAINLEHED